MQSSHTKRAVVITLRTGVVFVGVIAEALLGWTARVSVELAINTCIGEVNPISCHQ